MTQEQIDAMLRGEPVDGGATAPETSEASVNTSNENAPKNDDISLNEDIPNEVERGLLGEIYNISMGAAAKAVATMIKMKVDISTPQVTIMKKSDLVFKTLEPAVGVKINYIEGIHGENIFILSQFDIMKLVNIVVGGTGEIDESEQFDDLMHMSAIGEIMNQMMGASSMNVADFLQIKIDISVPETFKIDGQFPLDDMAEDDNDLIVATSFKFVVGDIINSEMITTCTLEFARGLIQKAMEQFGMLPAESPPVETTATPVEAPPPPVVQPEPEPEPEPVIPEPQPVRQEEPAPHPPPTVSVAEPEPEPVQRQPAAEQQQPPPQTPPQQQQPPPAYQQQYQPQAQPPGLDPNMYALFMQQQQQMQTLLMNLTDKLASNQMQAQPPPQQNQTHMQTAAPQSNVSMQPAGFRSFDDSSESEISYDNMDLVLDLPLDVAVEIGRVKKTVNEVLELGEGSIIELDKQFSEPVDVWVNGNLIAKGSVVVIEDDFAVRITEIVSPQDKLKAARGKNK